jgi:bifunctional non-homologous end joining protein LigD
MQGWGRSCETPLSITSSVLTGAFRGAPGYRRFSRSKAKLESADSRAQEISNVRPLSARRASKFSRMPTQTEQPERHTSFARSLLWRTPYGVGALGLGMSRTSTLPKRLQPMLATLTEAPFDDPRWVFEDKYDGFRMIAEIERGKVKLYSRNGKIISHSYIEVAKALEGVKIDAVIDGELVAVGKDGISHFQLLQNAQRHEAKLLYRVFDLMFENGVDLRQQPLLERKKRLKTILPRNKLIAFSAHRKTDGTKFFAEAERKALEGIMAKRADSAYASGSRTTDWLKIKTGKRQEVVIAGFTAPKRTRPFFGALVLAVMENDAWRYIGHVGTGFSHKTLEELHTKLVKLRAAKSPFTAKVKDEGVTTWVKPSLVAEVRFAEWTSKGEMRQPVYLGLRSDKQAKDVVRERERPRKSSWRRGQN